MATKDVTSARPRRILIVDDNADAAKLLEMNLAAAGHSVSVANDGKTALSAAASSPPEVVILDIGMAGMSGYEVARKLRSSAATERALLIAVTGWAGEGNRQRAMEAGFNHHFAKPVKLSELLAAIDDYGKTA